jgi:single-stranded DNA-binding protein
VARIVAWRRLGEMQRMYLKKGCWIYRGRILSRECEGETCTKRRVTEIIAVDLKLFPSSIHPYQMTEGTDPGI